MSCFTFPRGSPCTRGEPRAGRKPQRVRGEARAGCPPDAGTG